MIVLAMILPLPSWCFSNRATTSPPCVQNRSRAQGGAAQVAVAQVDAAQVAVAVGAGRGEDIAQELGRRALEQRNAPAGYGLQSLGHGGLEPAPARAWRARA